MTVLGFCIGFILAYRFRCRHAPRQLVPIPDREPFTITTAGGRGYGFRWTSEPDDGPWT